MKHQLGCEVDEVTGQILLAGIHDASVRGICHDRNGKVVLSLSGSSLEQCQLVVSGTKNAFVFSAGLALPLIVEAAFLGPDDETLANELGSAAYGAFVRQSQWVSNSDWKVLFTCSYGSPFVIFGDDALKGIHIVSP
ncbi:MAG: hypothetical protein QY327_02885 [Fimbriimonadaceae bacterium]|nr:MAG: hypothetical protein QY327_02885 [Fimbriimonadaceae bacterium]